MLSLLMSMGCWYTDIPEEDYSIVPFVNDYVGAQDAIVEKVETDFSCPDGEPAIFYAVYDRALQESDTLAPLVLVLHSSALDYVLYPRPEAPLVGVHYAPEDTGVHRISQAWGVKKVWETLGAYPQVDITELNEGTLPATLVNRGAVSIYPINCWGDLWHSDETYTPNRISEEYIYRNGATFSERMTRLLSEELPSFLDEPAPGFWNLIDRSEIHYVGLGDGARGVVELVRRAEETGDVPMPASIVVDSLVDDLNNWQVEVAGIAEALDRLYGNQIDDGIPLEHWSLESLAEEGVLSGIRVGLTYSSLDPRVPVGNLDGTVDALQSSAADVCIIDTGSSSHIQINNNLSLAQGILNFTLGETESNACP